MASLMNIPTELKDAIFPELSCRDLLSLSKTCRSLYSTILPFVYRDVLMSWEREAEQQSPNITSLLQTILEHPSRAGWIKTLTFNASNYEASRYRYQGLEFAKPLSHFRMDDDSQVALVRRAVDELCLPNSEKWNEAIVAKNDLGAIMALILAHCPELQRLTMDIDFLLHDNQWFPAMIKHTQSVPEDVKQMTRFNHLTHFVVKSPERYESLVVLPQDILLLCLYLPKVASLTLDATCGSPKWDSNVQAYNYGVGSFWPLPSAPDATSLTMLRLNSSTLSGPAMESILQHTSQLRKLTFDCQMPSSHGYFSLSELRKGLDHVKSTLSHLTFKFQVFADEALDVQSLIGVSIGSIGPLRTLTALTDLETSLVALYGDNIKPQDALPLADLLPPNLERLLITDEFWDYNFFTLWGGEPVMTLFKAFFNGDWKTATPKLQEFVLDMSEGNCMAFYWDRQEIRAELQQFVENQGVKCTILWDDDI